jgi:hypothetical protein
MVVDWVITIDYNNGDKNVIGECLTARFFLYTIFYFERTHIWNNLLN